MTPRATGLDAIIVERCFLKEVTLPQLPCGAFILRSPPNCLSIPSKWRQPRALQTLSPPKFWNEARMAELFGDDAAWRTLLNVTHHDNVLSFTFCAWGTERVVSLSLERHSSHRIVRVSGIGDWTWVPAVNRFLSSILSSQDADHLQRLCEACVEALAYDEKVTRLLGDLQKLMAADGTLGAADVLAMIDNAELKSRLPSFFPRVPTITVSRT